MKQEDKFQFSGHRRWPLQVTIRRMLSDHCLSCLQRL